MVAVGGRVAAALAISDPLKPEARGVVAALARRGLAVHLVTGDNWRAPPHSVPPPYVEQLCQFFSREACKDQPAWKTLLPSTQLRVCLLSLGISLPAPRQSESSDVLVKGARVA